MTYVAIYSNFGRIKNRVPQIDTTFTQEIEIYQRYIDSSIDHVLRSVLGYSDTNGMKILLPLTGDYDVIDVQRNQITLHMDADIQMNADDCVIAKFREDTAENSEKVEIAEQRLLDNIYRRYGNAISIDQDLSTEYLAANKLLNFNGIPIELFDGSGVLLWK